MYVSVFVTPNSDSAVTTTKSKEVTNDENLTEDDKNTDVKPPSEITKGMNYDKTSQGVRVRKKNDSRKR